LKGPTEEGNWETLPSISGEADAGPQGVLDDFILVPTTKPVDVWYHADRPGDAAKAQQIAGAISSTIYDSITGLMGGPLPDCGNTCDSGGPDSNLDIYIAREDVRAFTIWNPTDQNTCNDTSALIVVARTDSLAVVAHEFMHAVQFGYEYANCVDSSWWWEATAQWAMDYVYPKGSPGGPRQEEQAMATTFLVSPEVSLDFADDSHEYSAYLLPFFIARKHNPSWVRATFDAMQSHSKSLEALNSAMQSKGLGDFDDVWPQFTLDNWNREPVDDYKTWDQLYSETDPTDGTQKIDVGDELSMNVHVPYLAAQYEQIVFTDTVRIIEFDNAVDGEVESHQAVWAIAKIGGEWKDPEDLTEQSHKTWCRDIPEENIEELVLVFSNSDWEGKTSMDPEPSKLRGKGVGCEGWYGTMTGTQTWDQSGSRGTSSSTFTGTWVFDDPDTPETGCQQVPAPDTCLFYKPDGTISWTWQGHKDPDCDQLGNCGPPCDQTTSGSQPAEAGQFFLQPVNEEDKYKYYGFGGFHTDTPLKCSNPISGGTHPPYFFGIDERSDPSRPPGDGTNTCSLTAWRIEPDRADHRRKLLRMELRLSLEAPRMAPHPRRRRHSVAGTPD